MSTAAHGHDDHHAPFLAHHFEDHGHQFDSGKLGIWAFLGQELLFFSGLFCAYVIYRGNHPEIFLQGSHFLDVKWGAVNTCVLIFSASRRRGQCDALSSTIKRASSSRLR